MKWTVIILGCILLIGLASAAPVANFTENRTHLLVGQAVQFNDTSTGGPTAWSWELIGVDFFSSEQNPVLTFNNSGVYTITLGASNGSISYYTKTNYITVYPTTWNYTTPGTYTWQAPVDVNVTSISLDIGAGGGSGRGCYDYSAFICYNGYGGTSGEWQQYSSISVVEGANYTIVVGGGGPADPATIYPTDPGNSGGNSSAFGKTKQGGAGALGGGANATGGNGIGTGFLTSVFLAENGTSSSTFAGGTAIPGYSGGGGGAAAGNASYRSQYGGKGADGIVRISISGYTGGNVPNFVGSPTTGPAGTLVTFTDTSIIADPLDVVYNWSFGDGSFSAIAGNVIHVYPYTGSYTVTLTITSSGGTISETKEAYINLVTQQNYVLPTQPRAIRFKIVDAYGNDLPGAVVTANYINSSLPNTDISWLTSAFGVSTTVAGEMTNSGVAMQGMTGNDGSLSFVMYPVLQYGITITNTTAGLSKYVTIYPQDNDYIIYCPLASQAQVPSRATYLYNSSLYVTEPNASWITWNIIYSDTSGYTTGLTWNVTCWNNMTEMYSNTWGAVGAGTVINDNYTFPSVPAGVEYRALYAAARTLP
jgi:PKD repeat protein